MPCRLTCNGHMWPLSNAEILAISSADRVPFDLTSSQRAAARAGEVMGGGKLTKVKPRGQVF